MSWALRSAIVALPYVFMIGCGLMPLLESHTADGVQVANFSSVLEITFGINFLFVYFELRPDLLGRHRDLSGLSKEAVDRLDRAIAESEDPGVRRRAALYRKHILDTDVIMHLLDRRGVFYSAGMSLWSLGRLIRAGFHPDFAVPTDNMILFLVLAFLVPSLYYRHSSWLVSEKRKRLERADSKVLEDWIREGPPGSDRGDDLEVLYLLMSRECGSRIAEAALQQMRAAKSSDPDRAGPASGEPGAGPIDRPG